LATADAKPGLGKSKSAPSVAPRDLDVLGKAVPLSTSSPKFLAAAPSWGAVADAIHPPKLPVKAPGPSCDESLRWRQRDKEKPVASASKEPLDPWSEELAKLFKEDAPAANKGKPELPNKLPQLTDNQKCQDIYMTLKRLSNTNKPVGNKAISNNKELLPQTQAVSNTIRTSRRTIQLKVPKRHYDETPKEIDWSEADPKKWKFIPIEFNGEYNLSSFDAPHIVSGKGALMKGMKKMRTNPATYLGVFYENEVTSQPPNKQSYTLVERSGGEFNIVECEDAGYTFMAARYQALKPKVKIQRDAFTDAMSLEGCPLGKPVCPGRLQGCADVPSISVIGDVDPFDVMQGGRVGDCWLLCAMSALAEFRGAIEQLFTKTENIETTPLDGSNSYTVTLYDMDSWEPVDIKIDERLCTAAEDGSLVGCSPGRTGDLWACYLEKAVAIHCGGWDKIVGGQCTHAWRLLTGCRDQYTFTQGKDRKFDCGGAFNPNTRKWEKLANSPDDGFQGSWPIEWPSVGGGGKRRMRIGTDEMFERMCAWDDADYIMACASKEGSDSNVTDGITDGHTYTILSCVNNVAGTEFDLIKVRNPWGSGEFTEGKWDDDGPNWDKYPRVKAELNPTLDVDDGVFWMEKAEFFKYFSTIYLCALDMAEFVGPVVDKHSKTFVRSKHKKTAALLR
jgi:hypothetical protein